MTETDPKRRISLLKTESHILGEPYTIAKELVISGDIPFREKLEAKKLGKAIFIDLANARGDKDIAQILLTPYVSAAEQKKIDDLAKAEAQRIAEEKAKEKAEIRAEVIRELENEKKPKATNGK